MQSIGTCCKTWIQQRLLVYFSVWQIHYFLYHLHSSGQRILLFLDLTIRIGLEERVDHNLKTLVICEHVIRFKWNLLYGMIRCQRWHLICAIGSEFVRDESCLGVNLVGNKRIEKFWGNLDGTMLVDPRYLEVWTESGFSVRKLKGWGFSGKLWNGGWRGSPELKCYRTLWRVNHEKLLGCLLDRGVDPRIVLTLSCWFDLAVLGPSVSALNKLLV